MDIEAKYYQIIQDKLGVEESQITPEASFRNDLQADSLDLMELFMAFESEFNISAPEDQVEKLDTVGAALAFIKEETAKK
ncbi:MAG: acyl carrier protein [Ignavibacteriales bacterium]|nr:MAG: acyl carrier protein [Ignavibacteriaceae bacterium]MBV6444210.1 Acyl carrier protein [Ignavibacteriaceae bacterium]MBW7873913.1 acyl carrier protein [Ignavibacteria bacterium]MCZ2143328.1 acyl carrier protein [Ignavibacteriales bacterium]OQY70246.1 MAG: acyl carrier protein [Ignavibacteriales bacterium UTCHB3]